VYSREQASLIRKEFWTTFGQYMRPVPSASGMKANWINYRTGVKHIYFRMDADKRSARISIELTHPDAEIRELFFEQFTEFRAMLHDYLGELWDWQPAVTDDTGKEISRIGIGISGVNVFRQEDWSRLISFFKPRIVALDEFWTDVYDVFDSLSR
jgi:hypothetical protein